MQWQVEPAQAGMRLDRFVCERLELSRARARRLLAAGQVRVNGRLGDKGLQLAAGDQVSLPEGLAVSGGAVPEPELPLRVVHQDERLVVVDKPAGMHCHPHSPEERGSLAGALLARFPQLAEVGYGPLQPGLIHRLDQDTSGLLVAALDTECFEALRLALRRAELEKHYLALVAGAPLAGPSVERAWLRATGKRVRVFTREMADCRPIETRILSAQARGPLQLLTLSAPFAGRHQLRAHLAELGAPIVGDGLYGGEPLGDLGRHFLHASRLRFQHPFSGRQLDLQSPLPPELQHALERAALKS